MTGPARRTGVDPEALRTALEKVRDLLAAEARERTHWLSQAIDVLTALIEDGAERAREIGELGGGGRGRR